MAKLRGLGQRIEETRTARGISASALARLVGVTPAAVWNWENNDTMPRVEAFAEIAKVLGVTEEFLRKGTTAGTAPTSGRKSVASIIEQARNDIAELTELPPGRVRVNVEFATS
jgi:transcriptional regulator with XRE-family HTH domain